MIDFHQICNVFSFFVAGALSFLLLSASLYLFWHSHDTSIGMGNDVPHFSEVLFIFHHSFCFLSFGLRSLYPSNFHFTDSFKFVGSSSEFFISV